MSEENDFEGNEEYKPFGDSFFVKTVAILFVLAVYAVIFLKILFLK